MVRLRVKVSEKRRAFTGKRAPQGEADAPRESAIERFTRTGSIRPDGVSGRIGKSRVPVEWDPYSDWRNRIRSGWGLLGTGEGEERE